MSRCEVCGVHMDSDRKTCSRVCFKKLMSQLNNSLEQGANDPSQDEIQRRARVIREFNEQVKRAGGTHSIRKVDMYWHKD